MNYKKYIDIFILNYLLLATYCIIFITLKIEITDKQLFSTVDSVTYWLTGHEFYHLSLKGYSEIRPFLYPLIIVIIHNIFGSYGLWIMQFLFWIVSINLVFLSIKKITNSKILAFAGGIIIASNITYIVLTFHALTETTTIFLISVLICFISFNFTKVNTLNFFHRCLLILVLLAVVKPLFYLPLLFMLCIILPVFYFKKYIKKPKKIGWLILVITPIVFQIAIVKIKYNTFSFSKISSNTFRWYFLAQGMQQNENISWETARARTMVFSTSEELSYIFKNKALYFDLYTHDMKENIKAVPCFMLFPKKIPHPEVANYMIIVNGIYYYTHIVFGVLILICLYLIYRKRDTNRLVLIVFPVALTYYIFITIPISLWEGDRLVLPSLPLWVFLYSLVINYIVKELRIQNGRVT